MVNRTIKSLFLSIFLCFALMPVVKAQSIKFLYTVDVGSGPSFLLTEEVNGNVFNMLYGCNLRIGGVFFTDDYNIQGGIFATCSGYRNIDFGGHSRLLSVSSAKFGVNIGKTIHAKGSNRLYWVQDLGAACSNFSYDENRPEFVDDRWGVYIEEAIRYNYLLSSGNTIGCKFFINASYYLGKLPDNILIKPVNLTEVGVTFAFAF